MTKRVSKARRLRAVQGHLLRQAFKALHANDSQQGVVRSSAIFNLNARQPNSNPNPLRMGAVRQHAEVGVKQIEQRLNLEPIKAKGNRSVFLNGEKRSPRVHPKHVWQGVKKSEQLDNLSAPTRDVEVFDSLRLEANKRNLVRLSKKAKGNE